MPAVWSVVVQEFSSDGGNVPTHHPAMEEPTVLARWSEIETATLGLVTVIENKIILFLFWTTYIKLLKCFSLLLTLLLSLMLRVV